MDEIVRQAIAKWPSVPHCYGWLALDARGAFRMRDEAVQRANHPGDIIRHEALLAFIYRNYTCDERGAWFFQNGPQRVYVSLEATPYIARTHPAHQFVLHDGKLLGDIDETCLTGHGQLILRAGSQVAMLDDRDLAQCLPLLTMQGRPVEDARLMHWLTAPDDTLRLSAPTREIPVRWLRSEDIAGHFGFIQQPTPPSLAS